MAIRITSTGLTDRFFLCLDRDTVLYQPGQGAGSSRISGRRVSRIGDFCGHAAEQDSTGTIDRYSTAPDYTLHHSAGPIPQEEGVTMDKILRMTLGLLLVLFIASTSVFTYQAYVERAYRESLAGTYSYTCTITTDSPLMNVTFFLPVPADASGDSPVVAGFSGGTISGIPADWDVTLYDTGKATMVKIMADTITPSPGPGPYTIRMTADVPSKRAIDTRDPLNASALFRPVTGLTTVPCVPGRNAGNPVCYHYMTPLYADYETAADASVTIDTTITGRNTWTLFEPGSNEYTSEAGLQLRGAQQGWSAMSGTLTGHIGSYDTPRLTH
jgi:hypothetical protein